MYQKYPEIGSVMVCDGFWTPYLKNIRSFTLPYVFKKMEETDYVTNLVSVANKDGAQHIGTPFSDGLLFETLRAACDFLATEPDPVLEAYVDKLIGLIAAVQADDGFLCTKTMQNYPDKRWGDNDGDIVEQHDLYDHGCLIDAGISHYKATHKTDLLQVAVKAANLIVDTIGPPPKKNIVPGHSLPEEVFVKLYRLFRDDGQLQEFARQYQVNHQNYLDIAEFWYDARGNHEGRFLCKYLPPSYSQDHLPFAQQREAVGHSVRAMLCYLGAAAVTREKGREDFWEVLHTLWDSVVYKKLHISGGIGARHDIEGFDVDYHLPNKAYLETCAAIALAFWNAEMNLMEQDSKYFDVFEQSLYNNILSAVGDDFCHFFYQNPLESEGDLRRWDWHACPCCPPMLLKIFAALSSYIYSYNDTEINVNLLIGSSYENRHFSVTQKDDQIIVDSKGKPMTLRVRIPDYVENFTLSCNYTVEKGYAVAEGVWDPNTPVFVSYDMPVRRMCCNPKVEENIGKVAVKHGPFLMCAEGIDNGGRVDIRLAEEPHFRQNGDMMMALSAQGAPVCLIPYYRWCNRGETDTDAKMAVWLEQENMSNADELAAKIGEKLYGVYKPH